MNILVTGADGYLGSLLTPKLMAMGHDVTGVDTGFYKSGHLYHSGGITPRTIVKDIRHLNARDIGNHDAIVHLAALSNDPTGELAPNITQDINYQATMRLARLARKSGVTRFVFMSSCSVYGMADTEQEVTELSEPNPQTAYARWKWACERDVLPMQNATFAPVILRNATAYGPSPSQRFDLVVNHLAALAWIRRKLSLTSDGSPWRPLIHALDVAKAVCHALSAPASRVAGEIFNVGCDSQNLRVRDIASIVASQFDDCPIELGNDSADRRSYRVSFAKIRQHLPDFSCDHSVADGVAQFAGLFRRIDFSENEFLARPYTRINQLLYLLRTRQIDPDFFWSPAPIPALALTS